MGLLLGLDPLPRVRRFSEFSEIREDRAEVGGGGAHGRRRGACVYSFYCAHSYIHVHRNVRRGGGKERDKVCREWVAVLA